MGSNGSKALKYGAVAIGLYLLVAYAGGTKLVGTSASGVSNIVGTFQGRGKG